MIQYDVIIILVIKKCLTVLTLYHQLIVDVLNSRHHLLSTYYIYQRTVLRVPI
jgi:hypothetical protein